MRHFIPLSNRYMKMNRNRLISKLLELGEEAEAHNAKYLQLMQTPGKMSKAFMHERKALRVHSKIQELIRQIGLYRG